MAAAGGVYLVGASIQKVYASTWLNAKVHEMRHRSISNKIHRIEDAGHVRTQLQRELSLVHSNVREGHSHAKAASERNSATETMLAAIRRMGYEPYVISPSPREKDEDGSRMFYGLADMRQRFKNDPIHDKHIFVMTDVDYYVDMEALLSYARPVVCYSFTPQKVSGNVLDGYYTITDDLVHYRVTGGKDVRHPIWNYNQDTVYTCNPLLTLRSTLLNTIQEVSGYRWLRHKISSATGLYRFLFTIVGLDLPGGTRCTSSTIDQFCVGEHRNIISIVPFASCRDDVVDHAKFGARLQRMRYKQQAESLPNQQGIKPVFNVLRYISRDGPMLSLGLEGQLASLSAPLADVESLIVAHIQTKTANLSDTVRRSKLSDMQAALLHYYISSNVSTVADEVHRPGKLARHYQAASEVDEVSTLEQGKEYAIEYAPGPLTQTAVFPTESLANEQATIRGRLVEPQRAAKKRVKTTPKHYRWAADFVALMVGEVGKGYPYPMSYVEEKQQKPLQRARNEQGRMHNDYNMRVSAFQKREAYNAPNDPRNISTVPHNHNIRLSSYTYAFKDDVLKRQSWYMPCKTPQEIADAVQQLAHENEELVETDYGRFDGTFLRWIRTNVEHAAYRRWVANEAKAELTLLLGNELDPKAATKGGLKYDPECSRLSGSPTTTDGNSICNAFVSYTANRMSGMSSTDAYRHIGLAYGDDGLRGGSVTDGLIAQAASDLGFDLRVCNRAQRGKPVSFLSRVFADAWSSPASMQSPLRTLLKLHTSVDGVTPVDQVGWAKTTAYLVTDGQTPFISHWCRAYQRNSIEFVGTTTTTDVPYWVVNQDDLEHPWPQDSSDVWVGLVASDLGVSAAELTDHIAALDGYTGPISGLPRLTTNVPLKPKLTVTLDGEVHAGPINQQEDGPSSASTQAVAGPSSSDVQNPRRNAQQVGRSDRKRDQRGEHVRNQQPGRYKQASQPAAKNPTSTNKGKRWSERRAEHSGLYTPPVKPPKQG
jgi:hypothetical protein